MERLKPSLDSRGWIVALALLAAIVAWLVVRSTRDDSLSVQPGIERKESAAPRSSPEVIAAERAAAADEPDEAVCPEQQIEVSTAKLRHRRCMGRTQVIQNGSVRTYRVQSQSGAATSLTVDAAGERILRVELGAETGEAFACGVGKCAGVSMSPYDAQGARSVLFEKARLSRVVADAEESVTVEGRLRTVPDDELAATSCVGQMLLISQGPGTQHFCPDSGTGFDLDEDGGTTFRFTNHDGGTLAVSLDKAGTLRSVALGDASCRAKACSGVAISLAAADGRREFTFRGTELLHGDASAAPAILSGNLILAPQ